LDLGNWMLNVTNYDFYHKRLHVYINEDNQVLKFDAIFSSHSNQEAYIGLTKFNEDGSKYFFNHKQYNYAVSGSAFIDN
jgi:hypothetical protein